MPGEKRSGEMWPGEKWPGEKSSGDTPRSYCPLVPDETHFNNLSMIIIKKPGAKQHSQERS